MAAQYYPFGHHNISESEVFYTTQLSFAFVNNRPVRPGHVLVCPRREVKRVADLTADETCDLWLTAQKVGRLLESHHNASSLVFGIQDQTCDLLSRSLPPVSKMRVSFEFENCQWEEFSIVICEFLDGPEAGQTVAHVHIHIIPRNAGEFENNDDAYDEVTDLKEKKLKRRLDEEARQIRSLADMAAEADEYRKLLY